MMGTCMMGVASAIGLLASTAQADTTLRLSTWLPAQHSLQTTGFEPWLAAITEASGGSITSTIFPAQQLGSALDHYDIARDGIADLSFVNPGYQPGRFPVISLGEQPFHVSNAVEGSVAFDRWYREYAATEMPDIHYCMAFLQDPGTLHTVSEILVPGDLAGKTIRPGNATMGRMLNLLGAASVQVPAPEAREVIARGAAEGITFPWDSIFLFGIDEETTYHLDMPLYSTTFVMAMNKDSYDGMSAEEKAVMDAHCTSEWAGKIAAGWAEKEASGRDRAIASQDHHVHVPSEAEMTAWKEATAPLLEEWHAEAKQAGYDDQAIYDRFETEMSAANALGQ
ncbi:C4-dicarboxylate ABC transporter [Pseudooceanicola sediminis]|uniref:C4-dicarboxylate ABC transporter n=2 Tax=Pseudooceanicola sediminis TaxID=2211117 RepID=A0A399J5E0_9RHOB|nr:TRAP transporter substrate-binding protein [Puniceibacterium sp. HSS470]RII39797.1 C4-dicarboxylate ABC transporter [Pseudooceanicola sediminis]